MYAGRGHYARHLSQIRRRQRVEAERKREAEALAGAAKQEESQPEQVHMGPVEPEMVKTLACFRHNTFVDFPAGRPAPQAGTLNHLCEKCAEERQARVGTFRETRDVAVEHPLSFTAHAAYQDFLERRDKQNGVRPRSREEDEALARIEQLRYEEEQRALAPRGRPVRRYKAPSFRTSGVGWDAELEDTLFVA